MVEHKHKMVSARFNLTEHEDHIGSLIWLYKTYATWMKCDRWGCIHYGVIYHRDLIKPTTE